MTSFATPKTDETFQKGRMDSQVASLNATTSRTRPIIYGGDSVASFLTDDDGNTLLKTDSDKSTASHPNLGQIIRSSTATVDSVAPHLKTSSKTKHLPLATFCDLIAECASLERANIISVECWKERSRIGVVHRTLIFQLRRKARSDVWLRIDRDRSRDTPLPVFTLRGGRSEANDLAQIAGVKAHLLKRGISLLENRMEFATPPNLGVFRFCLQVISEELLEYRIWPENCWFMCSMLEEHLLDTGNGFFTTGKLLHLQLAPQIRARVGSRVHHIVSPPPSISNVLSSLSRFFPSPRFEDMQILAQEYCSQPPDAPISSETMQKLADHVAVVYEEATARLLNSLENVLLDLAFCTLALERRIYRRNPSTGSWRLLKAVLQYRSATIQSGLDESCLDDLYAHLQLFDQEPSQGWYGLACTLISLSRATSQIDPILARACGDGVKEIVSSYAAGMQLWTGGQILKGHRDGIISIAVSPDGNQIVSASADRTIIRWDALTGARVGKPLVGHTAYVRSVAYSPDSRLIVSSSQDRTLRLWDASSGEPVGQPMRGHTDWIRQAVFSPDGNQIASVSDDLTVRRWDVRSGQVIGEPMVGHTDWVWTVVYAPDGTRIVSGSKDNTMRIWDAASGKAIGEPWRCHTDAVTSVVFSPDGRTVVSGCWDLTIQRWDAFTGEKVGEPMRGHTHRINAVAFSSDGKRLVSGSSDHDIRLWDAATGDCIGEPLVGHEHFLESVAFTADSKRVVSGAWDFTVRIWDCFDDLDQWIRPELI